jgi:hydrogenase expression/formation protein HypE
MAADGEISITCPSPAGGEEKIVLGHGGGGRMMHRLLEGVILPALHGWHASAALHGDLVDATPQEGLESTAHATIAAHHDCAILPLPGPAARLAFTTDSYVVRPLFFPGGDIGTLAVNGTVNDLAMGGARPLWLSTSLILEEGLPIEALRRICASMCRAGRAAGVSIVTGDTKVVEHGKGDGIFINTAGVGLVEHAGSVGPAQVRPGDAIILSGDIGRHGIALMAVREGIRLETALESDCAPLAQTVLRLFDGDLPIRCLRDLTRGGLASTLVEIAEASGLALHIHEDAIPVHDTVRAVCEILGLDALHVANEGRFVAFVPCSHAERVLDLLHRDSLGVDARQIGTVQEGPPGLVTLRNAFGGNRLVDMLSGEQLPRIC